MHLMTAADDIFVALALALLLWARFSGIRDRQALRRSIRALREASRAWQSAGGDMLAIAEIAAQLHRIERGAAEIMQDGRRRLTVRLKGRTGRLDLVDNFFLRNPRVAVETLRPWQRPMLAIVRAVDEVRRLMHDTGRQRGLLVLDEPTEGIQPSIIKDIGRVIALLRQRGDMAILLVEQYFDFAHELAQTIAVMDRGDIVLSGLRARLDADDVRRRLSV